MPPQGILEVGVQLVFYVVNQPMLPRSTTSEILESFYSQRGRNRNMSRVQLISDACCIGIRSVGWYASGVQDGAQLCISSATTRLDFKLLYFNKLGRTTFWLWGGCFYFKLNTVYVKKWCVSVLVVKLIGGILFVLHYTKIAQWTSFSSNLYCWRTRLTGIWCIAGTQSKPPNVTGAVQVAYIFKKWL